MLTVTLNNASGYRTNGLPGNGLSDYLANRLGLGLGHTIIKHNPFTSNKLRLKYSIKYRK